MAARVKHIALSSDNPPETAAFYKEVFGMTELHRKPGDTGEEGVWLSDGYIYFAILKQGSHGAPNLGDGPSTVAGVHHIGFYVDDLEASCKDIETAAATECDVSTPANRKYKGPEGLMIDMRERGWDEQIQTHTQLYELKPAAKE